MITRYGRITRVRRTNWIYGQFELLGWADIVENDLVSISKEHAIVLNNIYLVILSSQKYG